MTPGVAPGGPQRRSLGVAALALAGFMFGSTFLVVQDAVETASVTAFLSARFLLAAAVLLVVARRRPSSADEVRHGVLAGLSLLAGYVFQTEGLRHTTSAASAFITYLLVVLVPVLHAVRTRRLPARPVTVGVVLAVVGLYFLSGGVAGFGRGELLTLLCALAFAVHLLIVGDVTHRHDPFRFTFWQVATVGVACAVPGAFSEGGFGFGASAWAAVVFTAVGATAVAFWCMAWGQRVVPEAQAALILLIEPVSAGVLGSLAGEELGAEGVVGAALILTGVVVAELFGRRSGTGTAPLPTELGSQLGDAS
ncbi:MAG: DMT family transporter [Microthrixaceae bacterium]|nr:DMT family transporter [Microthrixaceae bacterium]